VKLLFSLFVIVTVGLHAVAVHAGDAPAPSDRPWETDFQLVNATEADIQTKGILSVDTHRDVLEQALNGAKHSIELAAAQSPISYVLTDGPSDTLTALVMATAAKPAKATQVAAVPDPYPMISFYLGSYYDEIGKPDNALRVLDEGLALSILPDRGTGAHRVYLIIERGAALEGLRRWPDVLANEDDGLKLPDLGNAEKAKLYRGRGYALTELNRLDDAEDAYKESLNLEPRNELATHELGYIHSLKMGASRTSPGALIKVQKIAPPSPNPANP
jgi:tetratricopeptide (TPR) repeat protein